jgi:hypothetical protein
MIKAAPRKRKPKNKTRKPTYLEQRAKGTIKYEISLYPKKLHPNQAVQ